MLAEQDRSGPTGRLDLAPVPRNGDRRLHFESRSPCAAAPRPRVQCGLAEPGRPRAERPGIGPDPRSHVGRMRNARRRNGSTDATDEVSIAVTAVLTDQPLPVFKFPKLDGLRLWVLPFCLKSRQLGCPSGAPFADAFAVPDAVPSVEPSFHAAVALLPEVNAHAISEPISHPTTTSPVEPSSVAHAQPAAR